VGRSHAADKVVGVRRHGTYPILGAFKDSVLPTLAMRCGESRPRTAFAIPLVPAFPALRIHCAPGISIDDSVRSAALSSKRYEVCCSLELPLVPQTYASLYKRAGEAAERALAAGVRAGEIEFPATPNLNRAGDGSRRSLREAQESNAKLVVSLAKALRKLTPKFLCFDRAMMNAVHAELPENLSLDARRWTGDDMLADVLDGPVVGVTPPSEEEWLILEKITDLNSHGVVVANGMFYNGLDWLEPIFYVKPCSGWGTLILEYPRPYQAVSAKTGDVLEHLDVSVLQQGKIRRPDLLTVSKELQRSFYA
jgi:hypothetical protein